ncbi:cupin domain-containing protein [Amycolatopsis magusensis]|uniref:Mannose-6-phosphate isomerase-like protein (Cupin superfamily) n=1 Tax=Amycolatopsis magusensis TaxID=882444 RepID=A0ABS4PSR1_9PSEU|nr:cupin domain-containing protein [Amycolatopsis magusensis]MBP2181925.1 mannose-6-phosphate isomerase-like protein (cupin superfamily) [Amycolatopsis magusensis]MDI5977608.1 cupin domain-containing protein [Amycolatopsis magusensis]
MSTAQRTEQRVQPLVVRRTEAEVLGTGPDTISLLADVPATGGFLSATRTTLGEGQDGATPHYHRVSAETFFVLGGVLQVLLGEEIVTAREGDLLFVPPRTVHAFGAAPGSGADLLIAFTPGVERFGYFRLLGRIRDGDADPGEIFEAQERYDNHFVDSTVWRNARRSANS